MTELWSESNTGSIDHPVDHDYLSDDRDGGSVNEEQNPEPIPVEYDSLPKGFHQIVRERWERQKPTDCEQTEPRHSEVSVSEDHNQTTEWRDSEQFEYGGTKDDSMRTTFFAKDCDSIQGEWNFNRLWKMQFGKPRHVELNYLEVLEAKSVQIFDTDSGSVVKFKMRDVDSGWQSRQDRRDFIDSLVDMLNVPQTVRSEVCDVIESESTNYQSAWNRNHSGHWGKVLGYVGSLLNLDCSDEQFADMVAELRTVEDMDMTDEEIEQAIEYGEKRLNDRNIKPIFGKPSD
ncbi:hypothetical protein [Haloplanus pelagicus]|uniref:hypothetical protein n=1 Tax=Haloplanus pelagicus TaxID=2949995 RepID=UPI00203DD445|nr:hypothetical protein [Haloplanus sp. HW8-1]